MSTISMVPGTLAMSGWTVSPRISAPARAGLTGITR